MSIFGTGTDIAPVERFAKLAKENEPVFLSRMFTDTESKELMKIRDSALRSRAYCASFAIKESVFKALGTGLAAGMSWRDIEVENIFGHCKISTLGRTSECFTENRITRWQVSCSSTSELAIAFVILFTEE